MTVVSTDQWVIDCLLKCKQDNNHVSKNHHFHVFSIAVQSFKH